MKNLTINLSLKELHGIYGGSMNAEQPEGPFPLPHIPLGDPQEWDIHFDDLYPDSRINPIP